MIRKITASLLFAAFATLSAQAADPGGIALEVKAGDINMPVEDRGVVTTKGCRTCSVREFVTTPRTSYEIGDVQVRRDTLRRAMLERPNQLMLLQLTPDRKSVARFWISAAAE